MSTRLQEFREFREKMNARILESDNLEIKRFFALDSRAYEPGALTPKTKELLGLVASLVLRCDDCVTYHLVRCKEEGVSHAEFLETLNVGLVVGGSITIPHLRRAIATLDELDEAAARDAQDAGAGVDAGAGTGVPDTSSAASPQAAATPTAATQVAATQAGAPRRDPSSSSDAH